MSWQRLSGPFRALWSLWRRSLRVRVIATVVVLSAAVASGVGWLITKQIASGLVQERVETALAEARSETDTARQRLDAASGSSLTPNVQIQQLAEGLVSRGSAKGFEVIVFGPIGQQGQPSLGVRGTPDLAMVSFPDQLRGELAQTDDLVWTYTQADHLDEPVPAVAVGARVKLPTDAGNYGIGYLFPMTQESATLDLLQRTLVTSGLLLVVLVAGVAWVVTRQVLTPVGLARRVAERIASGRLEERMHVKGEDDIARLAISFNQMAESLQAQIQKLVELSRVQRTFVSDVSHELRTPLTTVRMASDVLYDARGRFDAVTERSAELLVVELDRFENLLTELLEISRFDAGAASLELDHIDVRDLVDRVVAVTQPVADQRDVRIVVKASGPCHAEIDSRRVERVLRNLVSNAIDHADGSNVVVELAQNDDAIAVSVRDRGVGLQPGQAAMVFNRFWRADPARSRVTGGTGLGLSISLEDAHLHGGRLQAWGEPGQGSNFRLTLPRRGGGTFTASPLPLEPGDSSPTDVVAQGQPL